MLAFPRLLRWLVALVVLTSTPGLGELVEGVVHAAITDGAELSAHHEADNCNDSCGGSKGCTRGLFHTCHCNASPMAPAVSARTLPLPLEAPREPITLSPLGSDQPAHRSPPFRPPSV